MKGTFDRVQVWAKQTEPPTVARTEAATPNEDKWSCHMGLGLSECQIYGQLEAAIPSLAALAIFRGSVFPSGADQGQHVEILHHHLRIFSPEATPFSFNACLWRASF